MKLSHLPKSAWAWAVGFLSLAFHGLLSLRFPAPAFEKYTVAAELFLDGRMAPERWLDFSPLYLYLTILLRRLTDDVEPVLLSLQLGLLAATSALFFLWAERRLGARWAGLGAMVITLDRHVLIYSRILEPEAIFLFLLMLFLYWVDGPEGEPTRPLAAGIVAALGIATRPTFLPICLLVLALWGWQRRDGLRRWIRPATCFLAAPALVMLLLAVRAQHVAGSWRAPTMNPGTVLYEGNQPMSRGTSAVYPPLVHLLSSGRNSAPDPAHVYYRDIARRDIGSSEPENSGSSEQGLQPLGVREVNRLWTRRALAFTLDHPGFALRRLQSKLLYAFHNFRWHDLPAAWLYDRALPLSGVPFALLSALALPGLLLEIRSRRDSLLLYGLLGSQLLVMMVFYISPRQRLMWIPLLIYFSLVTLRAVFRQRTLWPALLALVLVPAFTLPDDAMRDEVYQRNQLELARPILNEISARIAGGEPMNTLADRFAQALAHVPWWLDGLQPAFLDRSGESLERVIASKLDPLRLSPFDRAEMWMRAGEHDRARELLLQSLETDEQLYRKGRLNTSPELLLARLDLLEGRREDAEVRLRRGLQNHPGDAFLLAELIALESTHANSEHGSALFENLETYYGRQNAHFLVGRALLAQGAPLTAIDHLEVTVRAFPQLREAHLALAAALFQASRLDEGLARVLAADRIRAEPVLFANEMAELYEFAAQEASAPDQVLRAAQGLFHYGQPRRALALLDRPWPQTEHERVAALERRLRSTIGQQ